MTPGCPVFLLDRKPILLGQVLSRLGLWLSPSLTMVCWKIDRVPRGTGKAPGVNSRSNEPGKVALRIGQTIARIGVAGALVVSAACARGTRATRKMRRGGSLMQARSLGLASRAADSRGLPALVGQLSKGSS